MVKLGSGHDPLLRRPFSVFEVLLGDDGSPAGITLLNKRIGPSTSLLYTARPGQVATCLGPLGRPFTVVDPPGDAWMVAGGVGLAPFAALAQELVLTTEDGSTGERGRIVAPLERRLAARGAGGPIMIYACGPEGMLAATAKTAARFGRPCQVSVERIMGCGLGGCYSCVVPMRDDDGAFHHVRSCLAGPVLAADKIRWD
jgi:dihydroorotate dehydrogenase electron transfer subunit